MKDFNEIFETLILLEQKVAQLYLQFHHGYKEDSNFWWNIVLEEENHAAMIKTLKKISQSTGMFPEYLLDTNLSEVKEFINKIDEFLFEFESSKVTRETAFRFAYNIENSASEFHYQKYAESHSDSKIKDLFDKLNAADKNHAQRILEYAKENQIL